MAWKQMVTNWIEALTASPSSLQVGRLEKSPDIRRSPRTQTRFWTTFLDGPRTGTLTVDLSLEGCRVEGDFRSFVGVETRLCLEAYDSPEPLKLRGRIVWADGLHAGVRFLNLHVLDEVRLLRVLGRVSPAPPSDFLPGSRRPPEPHLYTLTPGEEGRYTLHITATNWQFRIELDLATIIGPLSGTFHHFQLNDSSLPLQRLRARQKICLQRPKRFLHLQLVSCCGETVLDILGEEVGFERVPRGRSNLVEAV